MDPGLRRGNNTAPEINFSQHTYHIVPPSSKLHLAACAKSFGGKISLSFSARGEGWKKRCPTTGPIRYYLGRSGAMRGQAL